MNIYDIKLNTVWQQYLKKVLQLFTPNSTWVYTLYIYAHKQNERKESLSDVIHIESTNSLI
jgi:hypothetical protein